MPMMKILDVLYDEGPCVLASLQRRLEPMSANEILKHLRTFADLKNVTCARESGQLVWRLTDEMMDSMLERRGEETIELREAKAPDEPARVEAQRPQEKKAPAPATSRKHTPTIVRPFIPARPEIMVSEVDGWVWISSGTPCEEPEAQIWLAHDEVPALIEALRLTGGMAL